MTAILKSYTRPAFETKFIDSFEDLVAYYARVSNPSNQHNTETSRKLIKYLLKHNHISPFEMVNVVLEIHTTRDIARQLLRHRSFSFQEYSQRYADPTKDLNFISREARLQDEKNRQNSIETDDEDLKRRWEEKQADMLHLVKSTYEWAVASGIAKEQARAILPEGNTESRLYVNGNLRSWIHYIQLRTGVETQKEHRELARECAKAIEPVFPLIMDFVEPEEWNPWNEELAFMKSVEKESSKQQENN